MNKNRTTGERTRLVNQFTKQKAIAASVLVGLRHSKETVASLLNLSVPRIEELLESKNLLTVEYDDNQS